MQWVIGSGNDGKIQQLEERLQRLEAYLQKIGGIGAAAGLVLTLIHLAFDYLVVSHRL